MIIRPRSNPRAPQSAETRIPCERMILKGDLEIPRGAGGVVIFAHGSGSSRHSPRNQHVARMIRESGIGTLLFDLLSEEEEMEDRETARLRFDIPLLAGRFVEVTRWLLDQPAAHDLKIGYFGSSTGGAAALVAAAERGGDIGAVVSRGGRPDLAGDALPLVQAPTLLIVGGCDDVVIQPNREAFAQLRCEKALEIVPGATHLFEEPGTLEEVARLGAEWFHTHLQ